MSKKVFHNGRTLHLQFSNDMDQPGAEYDMNTLSQLLDENISLDELKQQLRDKNLKDSRKRIINNKDELITKKHYHPNEDVHVNHLFDLDQNYKLEANDYKRKSKRQLKKEEYNDDNGAVLNTSAGPIHINKNLAEKYANGKKRLKIKNQYVTDNQLLTCENDKDSNKIINIPVRDRSTSQNYKSNYQVNLNDYTNENIKKTFPYGELALPSNGKTVTDNNYISNINWEKAVCSKYGEYKNNFNSLIVPEKYYQTNQNIPRTADEWEQLTMQGNNRFKEKLPNANLTFEQGPSISINDENSVLNEKFAIKPITEADTSVCSSTILDAANTSKTNKVDTSLSNISLTNPLFNISDTNMINNNYDFITLSDIYKKDENPAIKYSLDMNMLNNSNTIFTDTYITNLTNINLSDINLSSTDLSNNLLTNTYTMKEDNMNQYIQDEDGFVQIGNVGNGVNYSPRMHKQKPGTASINTSVDPTIFDQKKIHEQQIKEFGEYKPATQKDVIIEAKNHQGMTAAIALSVKIRDLKELVTEFAKNVNKIDHCIYDQMNETIFRMLKNTAKIKRHTHHKTTLYELDTDAEFFRDLIKLSVKLQYMSPKKGLYGKCVSSIDEIGCIIGGFIKRMDQFENKKKK